ncbi:hypothetical protein CVIRNUC_010654 [Coccomyxa viridis]|uniref:Uncharacterized protein n=1 Tax=Coccomyxa viridis TaxID=1274662 RepID=A0AAV1IJX8_9CHLO|nr:hypothetical protein CVIRNUC_010654 [Coccomyxa viridis]
MLRRCSRLCSGAAPALCRPVLTAVPEQSCQQQCSQYAALAAQQNSSSADEAAQELHRATRFWWHDENITAREGAKIVKQRLNLIGPQKAPHLMEVVRRVKTPEDAEVAMEVARQYALQRAHRQQHDGLSPNMSYIILKSITKVSVDKALDVIKSSRELALTFERRGFRDIIVRASKAGDLPAIRRAFQLLTATGVRPNTDLAYCILRACFDNKRPDVAVGYAREFEANGVQIRPAMKEMLRKAEADLQQKRQAALQEKAAQAKASAQSADEQREEASSEQEPVTKTE